MSMSSSATRFLLGVFSDENAVLKAVRALNSACIPIHDVFTPYAVHGLDAAMGIKRSRLPWVCFFAGGFGCLLGVLFQLWVTMRSWPLIVGGKPFFALPAFIPVVFEVTVLIGGLSIVAAFLAVSRMYPGARHPVFYARATDDRFVIAVADRDASFNADKVRRILADTGALEMLWREVEV